MSLTVSDLPTATRLYRPTEVAERLRIGRTKVFELISNGSLTSTRIGRCRLVSEEAVQHLLRAA
jgi:excisionase family DNA binding protein